MEFRVSLEVGNNEKFDLGLNDGELRADFKRLIIGILKNPFGYDMLNKPDFNLDAREIDLKLIKNNKEYRAKIKAWKEIHEDFDIFMASISVLP